MSILNIRRLLMILLSAFLLSVPPAAFAKLSNASLYHMIEQSDFILLGECTGASSETIELEYPYLPGQTLSGPRYGTYRVIKSWKDYHGDEYYTCDFLAINKAYEPDGHVLKAPENGRLPLQPEIDAAAYLFIKDGGILNYYSEGFAPVEIDTIEKYGYNEAITKLVALSKLNDVERINSFLDIIWDAKGFFVSCVKVALYSLPGQYFIQHFDEFIGSDYEKVRMHTLWAIEKDVDDVNISFLKKIEPLLKDSSLSIRRQAFGIINSVDCEYAKKYFLTNYDSFQPDIKSKIIRSYMYGNDCPCLDIYFRAAQSEDAHLRATGIEALRYCYNREAEEMIYTALNNENPEIQAAALRAASDHIKPILANYAYGLLKSPAFEVREAAVYVLGVVYNAYRFTRDYKNYDEIPITLNEITLSDDTVDVRLKALHMLTNIGSPLLMQSCPILLRDKKPNIRSSAAKYMGNTCDNQYFPLLDEALANETDESTILAIEKAMVRIYKYSPLPAYSSKIKDITKDIEKHKQKIPNFHY